MIVSLVLATVGRTEELRRCLESLSKQDDNSFEILVMDQNPDDRLASIVAIAKANGVDIRHIRLESPGLSNARNVGISMARGAVLAFPDDDCWYEEKVISAIRAEFEAIPKLQGCVACWFEQSQARSNSERNAELTSAAWRKFRGGDASSISLFLRKTLIDELGGFDPRLGVGCWYGAAEETDLVMRALSAGAIFRRCPEAIVHHAFSMASPEANRLTRQAARQRARGTGAIYAKHGLSAWTIFRGFVAPVFKQIRRGSLTGLLLGSSVSLGRIEGYLKWKKEEA